MRTRRLPPALLATAAIALTGCGITDPYTHRSTATATSTSSSTSTTSSVTNADPVPERGGTIPAGAQDAQNRAKPAGGTPQVALERFAQLDINWTARTVAAHQRELAELAVDQARAQALQAAASYGRDSALQASGVSNSGTVVAIAAGYGPAAGDWVIVTRESTSGRGDYAGLPPTDHVTLAKVAHTRRGWVVSSWSPQT